MLKLLRKGAIEKPWFYRTVMLLIATAFVISMGWFGFGGPSEKIYIAKVDENEISREEYRRSYERVYRFYRNMMGENFNEETIKKIVIESMIERQLWLKAAGEMGLSVSDAEVADALIRDRNFYRKGRFDPEQYRYLLANMRPPMTPEQYEAGLREDLLLEKARGVVRDGIILTDPEAVEARATVKGPQLSPQKRAESEARAVQNALSLKRQRAMASYLQSLRAQSSVEVIENLL